MNKNLEKFCVYLHLRKDNGMVFYIGQGTLKRANSSANRNKLWTMVEKDAGGFTVKMLHENLNKKSAVEIENFLLLNPDLSWNLINRIGPSCVKMLSTELFEDLIYSEESPSGLLWRHKSKSRKDGLIAGTKDSRGYWKISIKDKVYLAHRIIWLMFNGSVDPEKVINHIDNNPSNNKIENLEECTQSENCRRKKNHVSNNVGLMLHTVNNCQYWRAQYCDLNGKQHIKNFSVKKLGYNQALEHARQWRNDNLNYKE
jgi:hypothetical protein